MRIQHNITAMNSYRNYASNTKAVSKNLEKLSSGYKINRAGDDAAGLAISEKMRAQITGLETAQKNAKDGISLVQTAEGALTEVHSMLNRMFDLSEQSANGTYDNEVDRANLQKEVSALKTEIDRIADSSNFNGIKLLDGSLGGKADIAGKIALSDTKATAAITTSGAFAAGGAASVPGQTLSYTVAWKEGDSQKSATINLKVNSTTELEGSNGSKYVTTVGGPTADEMAAAVLGELTKDSALTAAFDVAYDTTADKLTFTSKVDGSAGAVVTALGATASAAGALATSVATAKTIDSANTTIGLDSMQKLDVSQAPVLAAGANTAAAIAAATFEVDGKKFALAANGASVTDLKDVPGDVTVIELTAASYVAADDNANIASEISRVTGKTFSAATAAQAGASSGDIAADDIIYAGSDKLKSTGKELTLQIGDTAEDFNKLAVAVEDMHASALGIGSVDIASQTGGADAMAKIKTAINTVSSTRGDLGALQNRLDHTINNLSVMTENIQDAESSIRDVDVAKEMMAYTKNNILVQSAQAMLAQANQLPQGVLQLLG